MPIEFFDKQAISSLDPSQLLDSSTGSGWISGGNYSTGTDDFDVDITAPAVLLDGEEIRLSGETKNVGEFVDPENPRWVLIYVSKEDDPTGAIEMRPGEPEPLDPPGALRRYAARPTLPDLSDIEAVPLVAVWVGSNDEEITDGDFFDRRVPTVKRAYSMLAAIVEAGEIIDGEGFSHTNRLAEAGRDTDTNGNVTQWYDTIRTNEQLWADVLADPNHGDRTNAVHAYRTDEEIKTQARTLDASELQGSLGENGQYLKTTSTDVVWSDIPQLNPPVVASGTFTHTGGSPTEVLLSGVSNALNGSYEIWIGQASTPTWATTQTPEWGFDRSFVQDYANNKVDIRVTANWQTDPGPGNDINLQYAVVDTQPQVVQGDYSDSNAVAAMSGEAITPRIVEVSQRLDIPVYNDLSTVAGPEDGSIALATGANASWEAGLYYYLAGQGGWRLLLASGGDETKLVTDTEASRANYSAATYDFFIASDTGRQAASDGSTWTWIGSTGQNPTYSSVTTDRFYAENSPYDAIVWKASDGTVYADGRNGPIGHEGDGTYSNERQVIQAALDSTSRPKVGLAPGEYSIGRDIARSLRLPTGTTLEGMGPREAVTLRSATVATAADDSALVSIVDQNDITLRNLTINGQALNGAGNDRRAIQCLADVGTCSRITVENCVVRNFQPAGAATPTLGGIRFGSTDATDSNTATNPSTGDIQHVRFRDCLIESMPATDRENVRLAFINGLRVIGCRFSNLGHSVYAYSCGNIRVSSNRFSMSNAQASLTANGFDMLIGQNHFTRRTAPLRIEHDDAYADISRTQRTIVTGNTVVDSGIIVTYASGTTSGFPTRVLISNNIVGESSTHTGNGIDITGSNLEKYDITIASNVVAYCKKSGIRAESMVNSLISNNTVFNNDGSEDPANPGGIRLVTSRNSTISNNTVYDRRATSLQPAGIQLADTTACSVMGNMTRSNLNSSIIELGSANNNRIGFNICWEKPPTLSGANSVSNYNM